VPHKEVQDIPEAYHVGNAEHMVAAYAWGSVGKPCRQDEARSLVADMDGGEVRLGRTLAMGPWHSWGHLA
jgi:hypothetical protein